MNRRGFLRGLIAAQVGLGAIVASSDGLPTQNAVKTPELKKSKELRYLFVVPQYSQAQEIYRAMGSPRNVTVIGVGGMLCGYGADYVLMDDIWDRPIKDCAELQEKRRRWYNESVRTRLYPGGVMDKANFVARSFNFDQEVGIQMTTGSLRQGMRFMKSRKLLTARDWVLAKAKLFNYYIEQTKDAYRPAWKSMAHDGTDAQLHLTDARAYYEGAQWSKADRLRMEHMDAVTQQMARRMDAQIMRMKP